MAQHDVIDQGDAKKYFTQIPNIVFDIGLNPQELALYAHLKRAVGAKGDHKCRKSTRRLAMETGMGTGSVSRAKASLQLRRAELGNRPLIRVREQINPHGGKPYDEITITDIWRVNMECFTSSDVEREDGEQVPNDGEQVPNPSSILEPKNNSLEEEHKEERTARFFAELKANPAYAHIDIEREYHKMRQWLALPMNQGRQLTPKFVLNWLNKIEPPLESPDAANQRRASGADAESDDERRRREECQYCLGTGMRLKDGKAMGRCNHEAD